MVLKVPSVKHQPCQCSLKGCYQIIRRSRIFRTGSLHAECVPTRPSSRHVDKQAANHRCLPGYPQQPHSSCQGLTYQSDALSSVPMCRLFHKPTTHHTCPLATWRWSQCICHYEGNHVDGLSKFALKSETCEGSKSGQDAPNTSVLCMCIRHFHQS